MAKPKRAEDKDPVFPATAAYKQWVWEEMRRRGWTQQKLVDEMKKADRAQTGGRLTAKSSTAWLTGFLGGEHDTRRYANNTELMPALNKALGIAPPSICQPDSALAQLHDRIDYLWRTMTPAERERFLKAMEGVLNLTEHA